MTRILIADDHVVVRLGLRQIIETHSGWHVVAEAENGKDAIAKSLETKPDVAVLDYSLPLMNGMRSNQANPGAASQDGNSYFYNA